VAPEEPKFRRPRDELVLEALDRVTASKRTVTSQRALRRFVEKELRGEERYRVGERRLRLLAIRSGRVHLETLCRELEERGTVRRCPVCGTKTTRLRNATVFGGTVTLGSKCEACGYWTGLKRRVPTRYVFTRK
jgi:hypothetical protein